MEKSPEPAPGLPGAGTPGDPQGRRNETRSARTWLCRLAAPGSGQPLEAPPRSPPGCPQLPSPLRGDEYILIQTLPKPSATSPPRHAANARAGAYMNVL